MAHKKSRSAARDKWEQVIKEYGTMCVYCGIVEADTIDHVIPLSRGGTNELSNLRPACRECNMAKGNRLPTEMQEPAEAKKGKKRPTV